MRPHRLLLWAAVPALAAPLVLAPPALAHSPRSASGSYTQTVIVADQAPTTGSDRPLVDPALVNPWGVAFSAATPTAPGSPLWTSDNGTGVSTLYRGTSATPTAKVALTVTTPPAPTGVVFNSTSGFALPDGTPSRFIFDTLSHQIAAWAPPATSTVTTVTSTDADYTGLAIGTTSAGPRLYAADATGVLVRVYDGDWHLVGVLRPRRLPAGLVAYGVAFLGGDVYVSYAPAFGTHPQVHGAVQVFRGSDGEDADATGVETRGRRLVTGGVLDEPWGLAIAPRDWGRFGGDLLVGNVHSGQIDAYSLRTGRLQGVVSDATGQPIVDDGLWGIQFGNGTIGTPQDLVVAAGTGGYKHGIVALIRPTG